MRKTPVSGDTYSLPISRSLSPLKQCCTSRMCSQGHPVERKIQLPEKSICFFCNTSCASRRLANSLNQIGLQIVSRIHWSVQKMFKTFPTWMPLTGFTSRSDQCDVETTNMATSLSFSDPSPPCINSGFPKWPVATAGWYSRDYLLVTLGKPWVDSGGKWFIRDAKLLRPKSICEYDVLQMVYTWCKIIKAKINMWVWCFTERRLWFVNLWTSILALDVICLLKYS